MDVKKLEALCAEQGFTWHFPKGAGNGSRHTKITNPDGRVVAVASSSPSDHRQVKNLTAQLKRAGLIIPRKDGKK